MRTVLELRVFVDRDPLADLDHPGRTVRDVLGSGSRFGECIRIEVRDDKGRLHGEILHLDDVVNTGLFPYVWESAGERFLAWLDEHGPKPAGGK